MKLDPADFEYVRRMMLERSSVVLRPEQEYLVHSRLTTLSRATSHGSVAELVKRLREQPHGRLAEQVVDAMTTNETSFFRDARPFTALRERVIPDLLSRRATRRELSIWSAACSTGQEPYSLAMLLLEHFPWLAGGSTKILATDVSRSALGHARRGVYGKLEAARGLSPHWLDKYFEREGPGFRVRDAVRPLVDFQLMNLASASVVLPRFDLVLMRNVLIYFAPDTRASILRRVERSLAPDGYLLLGATEGTYGLCPELASVTVGDTVFFRRPEPLPKTAAGR